MIAGKLLKGLKITVITIAALLTLILFLPEIFPGYVSKKIKEIANENIEGELQFDKARFSFLKHFPALTLSVLDFSLTGKGQFEGDTLLAGKELAFGVNVFTIFKERISLNQFFLEDGLINILVDSLGNGNYDIAKSSTDTVQVADTSSGGANLRIERIRITNSRLVYRDHSLPMLLILDTLNYEGRGDLTLDIVDLESTIKANGINFSYDGEQYAVNKRLKADLVTRINTENLELSFTRNDLMVNELPVDFKGFIRFPESGYDIDLRFKADKTNLRNVITVLPPAYLDWLNETEVKGMASLFLDFFGKYRAETGESPSLYFGLDINEGYVRYAQAPLPVSDMGMRFRLAIPSMDYDSFSLNLDTLHLNLGNGFLRSHLHMASLNKPHVKSVLQANADLGQLMQAIGYKEYQLQGTLIGNASFDYNKATGYNGKTRRMPYAKADIAWQNGFLQTPYYPAPIKDIDMKVILSNDAGTYRDMKIDLQPITFTFEGQPFMIKADVADFESVRYDVVSKGTLDLEKLGRVFVPEEYGLNVEGFIEADVKLKGTQADAEKGRYNNLNNSGTLLLKNIKVKSDELPYPIVIKDGFFRIVNDKLNTNNLQLIYGSNTLSMQGFYNNLFPYMVGTGPLKGGLKMQSDKLILDEFLVYAPGSELSKQTDGEPVPTSASGVAMLPKDLDLTLEAVIKQALYEDYKIEDIKGEIRLDKGKLTMQDAGARMAGASAVMHASYEGLSPTKALFDVDIKADSFDIQRFYKEVPMFATMATAAKDVKGQVSLKYQLVGRLDANMMPVMPSLKGGGTLSLHNVDLKGFKLFSAVAKTTGRDSVANPNLKAVNLNTTIANNVMTLERTKMRIFGFRPRIEGQATLDGRLNLRFRLGLPPFGIIGIPMTVTGTMESPKVQMRRGKEGDMLEEEDDDEYEEEEVT
jgi:AsmA protein